MTRGLSQHQNARETADHGESKRSGFRRLLVGRLEDGRWEWVPVCQVDHNYDHGSIWIREDGIWEIIAPIGPGSQPYTTGGEIQRGESRDSGRTWACAAVLTPNPARQHTYVRKPLDGHPRFRVLLGRWKRTRALRRGLVFRQPRRSRHADAMRGKLLK